MFNANIVSATKADPNAPKPEGQVLKPVVGEQLQVYLEINAIFNIPFFTLLLTLL